MSTFTPTRTTVARGRYGHDCSQGFCTVCGTSWPCWRAESDSQAMTVLTHTAARGLPRC